MAGSGVTQLILPHMLDAIHLTRNTSYGIILSIMGLAETGMSLLWSRWSAHRSPSWIFEGYLLRATSYGLLFAALSSNRIVLLVGATALLGAAMPISGPPFIMALQGSTPRPLMGKVLSIRSTLGNVSHATSYLLTGWLLAIMPLRGVLGFATALAALSAGVFFSLWSRQTVKSEANRAS